MSSGYRAFDGTQIDLPELPPLPASAPVFSQDDLPWLASAMSLQKEQLVRFRAEAEGANYFYVAKIKRAEALWKEGYARYDEDGAGFLDALNSGALWSDFWGALAALIGSDMENPRRAGQTWQVRIAELLVPLLKDLRVHILAQGFLPVPKPTRTSEALFNLMAEELAAPGADLRHWEVGMDADATTEDMPDAVLIDIATRFMRSSGQIARFVAHATNPAQDKSPMSPQHRPAPGEAPADRADALAILTDVPIAKRHGEGMTQADVNFHKTQAFHACMRALKPGVPTGHLMHLALSQRSFGPSFPKVVWDEYPRATIWPYIASHRDMIARALAGDAFPWEPKLEPIKVLKTLAYLPKLPADLAAPVAHFAKAGTKAQKAAAAVLLDG